MNRLVKFLVCAFAVVAIAGIAQAADVTLWLRLDTYANSWTLRATASQGDNDGIAGYAIDIVGGDTAISLGPKAVSTAGVPMGFSVGNESFSGDGTLFAGQDSWSAAPLMYGIGQRAWADDFAFLPGSENALDAGGLPIADTPTIPFDANVMLGRGTGHWFSTVFDSARVTVWSAGMAAVNGTDAEWANVFLVKRYVPEPTSFVILGILSLGLGVYRRPRCIVSN